MHNLLVALAVATVGLALFPFTTRLTRPDGSQAAYRAATTALRAGRRISWLLAPLMGATLAGYVVLFVRARGRFCDAQLDQTTRAVALVWAVAAVATFAVLGLLVTLRHRAGSDRS